MSWALIDGDTASPWMTLWLVALVAGALALGRRYPVVALVIALGALCLSPSAPSLAFVALVPVCYALFRVAAGSRMRVSLVGLAGCLVGSVATALPGFEHRGAVLPFAMAFITTWTVGYAVRQQRTYLARLAEHHRQLVEAEITRAREGVIEQRLLIARELHDVVAHNMSVITVQAAFGHLVIDQRPDQARDVLGVIEQLGRRTMTEMRVLMGCCGMTIGARLRQCRSTPHRVWPISMSSSQTRLGPVSQSTSSYAELLASCLLESISRRTESCRRP